MMIIQLFKTILYVLELEMETRFSHFENQGKSREMACTGHARIESDLINISLASSGQTETIVL